MSTSIAADSSSTRRPTVAIGPPSPGIHDHSASPPRPSARMRRARTNDVPMATMPSQPAGRPERRRGRTRAWATNAANGKARTARAVAVMALPSQKVEMIGVDRPPYPEDHDHDGQPEADLGHGDGDGEEREDQAHHVAVEAREGYEVDVDGVQHQLDAEQDAHGVAPAQDAEQTDDEDQRGEDEIGRERHEVSLRFARGRRPRGARPRAARRAARRSPRTAPPGPGRWRRSRRRRPAPAASLRAAGR